VGGRTFPFLEIDELRAVLEYQRAKTETLQKEKGVIVP
jgi:hypothetical protein